MKHANADALFKKPLNRSESKAEQTNRAAMGILLDEQTRREAKTDKLRQLRLSHEATIPLPAPRKSPVRRTTIRRGHGG